jgi:flavin-binding protein dodecin
MSDHTYGISELVGTSATGVDDAIRNAIRHAKAELPHLDWFEMVALRGHLTDGEIAHYQVTIKVGYRFGAGGR